ncbi:MAG: GntR family transcriptional regulator [Gaiellales bacterium]
MSEPSGISDGVIQRVSVVDTVTERLRNALLGGEIKPGDLIKVAALEKSFGVSHIPIREAVRRLETEGLIIAQPQRAAVAAGVDLEDLAGVYDLRRIIECSVIERSVASMTDEQIEQVRDALARLDGASDNHDSPAFWDLHAAFHWALVEPGASAWIQRVLELLWVASQRYVRLFVSRTVEEAMRDHHELFECCVERDGPRAAAVLERHLDRTENAVREAFVGDPANAEEEG